MADKNVKHLDGLNLSKADINVYSNSLIPPTTAPAKPSKPKKGRPNTGELHLTVMTMEEPIINAAVIMPMVSRLMEQSIWSAK
jgi:hypothetical protein